MKSFAILAVLRGTWLTRCIELGWPGVPGVEVHRRYNASSGRCMHIEQQYALAALGVKSFFEPIEKVRGMRYLENAAEWGLHYVDF